MAIVAVVKQGSSFIVKNEHGQTIRTIDGSGGATLHGYTATTVSIRRKSTVTVYNERGQIIKNVPA